MALSKRFTYNLDFLGDDINSIAAAYAFINHFKTGGTVGPVGANWFNGTRYWTQSIDSNGYPNVSALTDTWGGGFYVPTSSNFAGPYVLAWDGDGTISFLDNTWTETTMSGTGAVKNSNGNWSNAGGSTSVKIVMNMSGSTQRIRWRCTASGRGAGNSSQNLTNLRFYRQADETDLLAGKIYRSAWKQQIIDFNPGVIRFMNWFGGNASESGMIYKYSHVRPSTYVSYGSTGNIYVDPNSPKYTNGTQPGTTNAIVVSSVTGTPSSMQHGEVCSFLLTDGIVRGGTLSISNIADLGGGSARVTTTTAHGFNVGDQIIHYTQSNMVGMYLKVAAVTNISDTTHYDIAVDVSGMGSWSGTGSCTAYVSLQVGSGNDRTAYPVVCPDGLTGIAFWGTGAKATVDIMGSGQYKTFIFDKNCVAAQGITGAWLGYVSNNANMFLSGGVPASVMTALMTELKAQGWHNAIDMWINMPYCGMLSVDSNYSLAENPAVQMTSAVLSGLPSECNLWVEFSNETWNYSNWPNGIGGTAFYQGVYLTRWGYLRNNSAGIASIDKGFGTTIRSLMCMYDIKQNIADARLKYINAGQGTLGWSSHNSTRITGSALVTGDSFFISLGLTAPIDYYDAWAWGCYIGGSSSGSGTVTISQASPAVFTKSSHNLVVGAPVVLSTTGSLPTGLSPGTYYVASTPTSGTFTVSATYGGTAVNTSSAGSGTHTATYGFSTNRSTFGTNYNAASTDAGRASARQGFIDTMTGTTGAGETVAYYRDTRMPAWATESHLNGKASICYEGGWDPAVSGTGFDTFMSDCQSNYEWAWAWLSFANACKNQSNQYFPAIYVQMNQRWAQSYPDTYSGGVEGGGLFASWQVLKQYNNNKRRFKVTAS